MISKCLPKIHCGPVVSRLSEYILVAIPDDELAIRLISYQQRLVQQCYPYAEILPVRHLLLASMMAKDYLEDIVSRWIMKICQMKSSFSVEFEPGLSHNQGVLLLEMVSSASLNALSKQLHIVDDFVTASDSRPLQVINKPHLPLLIPRNYQPSDAGDLAFEGSFKISSIAMMKRNDAANGFERINTFGLSS